MNLDHIQTKSLLILTRSEIDHMAEELVTNVISEGYTDSPDLIAKLEKVKRFVESAKKKTIDYLANELDREPERKTSRYGVEMQESSTGDRLDYEQDIVYSQLKQQLKEREQLLKLAYKQTETLYDNDGVAVPKVPLKYASRTIYKVTLR